MRSGRLDLFPGEGGGELGVSFGIEDVGAEAGRSCGDNEGGGCAWDGAAIGRGGVCAPGPQWPNGNVLHSVLWQC